MKPSLSSISQLSVGLDVFPENSHSNHAPVSLSIANNCLFMERHIRNVKNNIVFNLSFKFFINLFFD